MKSFNEIRNYVNSLEPEKMNKDTMYFIESEISDRYAYIVNDVKFERNGQYYLKTNASKWLKQMFAEIMALEKAKNVVKGIII